jgi:hypothetical protein
LAVQTVYIDSSTRLIITAPNLSPTELGKLRDKVNDPTRDIIAVNYELGWQTVAIEE